MPENAKIYKHNRIWLTFQVCLGQKEANMMKKEKLRFT
jgi:hypothetical protein